VASESTSRTSGAPSVQDMASWTRDGIAGLQSVVLYSLPELDGAVDTIPLGGLVNNDIYLVPERVERLAARIKKWVDLRRTAPKVRGHPPPRPAAPPGRGVTSFSKACLFHVSCAAFHPRSKRV